MHLSNEKNTVLRGVTEMKKHLRKIMIAAAFAATSLVLTSCEEDEASAVAAAQDCLNEMRATMSEAQLESKADQCRSLLGTPASEKGFIVECSSYFLEEGFFSSQVIEAFDRIDDSGENASTSLLSVFSFKDEDNADAAQVSCSQTGLKTLQVFGELAKTATTIGAAFPGGLDALFAADSDGDGIPEIDDFEAALAEIDTAEEFEDLGTSVTNLAQTLCASGESSFDEACPTLNAVTSASSAEDIGRCMQFCMDDANKGVQCTDDTSITCPD